MGLPLDPKLAVLYGKCVNAAYGMYKRDCSVLQPEPNPGDIPDPYELVAWVNMSDFIFDNKLPQFYGYIARNKNDRHDFILAIRGTEGLVEWIDDVFIHLVPFAQVPHAGRVAQGFDQIYSSLKVIRRPHTADGQMKAAAPGPAAAIAAPQPLQVMTGSFLEQIEQLADSLEPPAPAGAMALAPEAKPRRSFVVAGHSLGAALTTLFVIENKEKGMHVRVSARRQHAVRRNLQPVAGQFMANLQRPGCGAKGAALHSSACRLHAGERWFQGVVERSDLLQSGLLALDDDVSAFA